MLGPIFHCWLLFSSFFLTLWQLMKVAFHLFDGKYVNSIIFHVKRKIEWKTSIFSFWIIDANMHEDEKHLKKKKIKKISNKFCNIFFGQNYFWIFWHFLKIQFCVKNLLHDSFPENPVRAAKNCLDERRIAFYCWKTQSLSDRAFDHKNFRELPGDFLFCLSYLVWFCDLLWFLSSSEKYRFPLC